MKINLIISLFACLLCASSAFRRSSNLVVERPSKPSKGLLEKPELQPEDEESDEISDSTRPSWFRRVWSNAFGRRDPEISADSDEMDDGFFSSLRPWWKGPNVCNHEHEYNESRIDSNVDQHSFFRFFMTNCHDTGRSYKCTRRTRFNRTTTRVHTLIYECCFGYGRENMRDPGCTKRLDLSNMLSTLRSANATKYAQAVVEANLNEELESGKATIFAPMDGARVSDIDQNDISVVVLETPDKMQFARDILRSHVIPGPRVYSSDDFEDEMLLHTSTDGASIRINIFRRPQPFATANCARIMSSDRQATTGYVHTVDRALTPVKRNLWQLIEDDARFSTFRSLADDSLKQRLADQNQHLTLLAFNDETFEKLPANIRQSIREKNDCFKNLLLHHVLPHTICKAAVYDDRGFVRNAANRPMNATRTNEGVVKFGNGKVLRADLMATNGVMHVIDDVILSPEMLDIIGALDRSGGAASEFASALRTHHLITTLTESQNGITVFVPPSQSISSLGRDDLRNHIVRQSVFDRFRVVLDRPRTMLTDAGRNVTIRFEYDQAPFFSWETQDHLRLHVGCAKAQKIASSCDGAIVYLDKALTAPTKNAYELLISRSDLSEFVSMIDQAGLAYELKSNSLDATLLAPNNQALEHSLSRSEKRRLMNNQANLRRFLKQHIILGTKCCSEFGNDDWFSSNRYTTKAGTQLTSMGRDEENLRIGGANVEECDLIATNGLVHVVDGTVQSRRTWRFSSVWERDDDFFDDW